MGEGFGYDVSNKRMCLWFEMCLLSLNRYLLRFFLNVAFWGETGRQWCNDLKVWLFGRIFFHTLVMVDLFIDLFYHPYLCWLSYDGHWDDSSSPRKTNDLKGNFIIHGRPSFHKVVQNVLEKNCRNDFLFGFELGKHQYTLQGTNISYILFPKAVLKILFLTGGIW